ncbi:MAG: hypothetical protein NVS4B11_21310 [Ktedonobacteraceae bacterium]
MKETHKPTEEDKQETEDAHPQKSLFDKGTRGEKSPHLSNPSWLSHLLKRSGERYDYERNYNNKAA